MDNNYYDTFIQVAPDTTATEAREPTARGDKPTVATIQYELLRDHPYEYTQEQVLFETHVRHKNISADELVARRDDLWNALFSKPQACLRASPLPKQWGWGLHFDTEGRVALVPMESDEYREHAANQDGSTKQLFAMRSRRG